MNVAGITLEVGLPVAVGVMEAEVDMLTETDTEADELVLIEIDEDVDEFVGGVVEQIEDSNAESARGGR